MKRLALTALVLLAAETLQAARYPAHLRWMSWRTGEVHLFYPEGYEHYARVAAREAKASLDTLEAWYGQRPSRTRILLNPEEDLGGSMAIVQPLRTEISVNPALDKGLRPQRGLYLRRVVAHELTHLVHFSTHAGITRPARWLFGDAVAPLGLSPDWILEGQAIWTESRRGGGRFHSSYHRMLFRTPLLEGRLWELDQIAFSGSVAPHRSRAYVAGSFLYGDLVQEFRGYRRISEWMRAMAAMPGLHGAAFRSAFEDRTAAGEYRRLVTGYRKQERSRLQKRTRAGIAVGRQLLKRKRTSWRHPDFGPAGDLLVRERSYDRPPRLVRLAGPDLAVVREGPNLGSTPHAGIAASSRGAVVSRVRRGWAPQQNHAWLVHVATDGARSETGLRGWAPAWHEPSGRLAWITRSEGAVALKAATLDGDFRPRAAPRTLLTTPFGLISDPAWSPGGDTLAFAADLGDGEAVYLWSEEQDSLRRLRIEGASATWDPAFAPSGALWVSADPEGVFDLFEVDPSAGTALRRTRAMTGAVEPTVSPDGRRVAYSHYTSDGFSLALLDSTRWLAEPAGVGVETISPGAFAQRELLDREPLPGARPYRSLRHAAPIFWSPLLGGQEETALGATLLGRDPLGLLSWRATGLWGLDSEQLYGDGSITSRSLPLDLTLFAASSPARENRYEGEVVGDSLFISSTEEWTRRTEGGAILHQEIRLDRGPWAARLTPFAGWVTRERVFQDIARLQELASPVPMTSHRYHGARGGLDFVRWYGAPRDPVVSRLLRFSVSGERSFPGLGDLQADLLEAQGRLHLPGPGPLVLALKAAGQVQNAQAFHYSRAPVRPRGQEELPRAVRGGGRTVLGGVELHAPLFFPDRGIGMGWSFLRRVEGSLFAEGATGWGGGRALEDWVREDGSGSVGLEVSLGGYLFYEVQMRLYGGVALRLPSAEFAPFWGVQLPSVLGGVQSLVGR